MNKTFCTYEEFLLNEVMAIDSMFDLYLHIYNTRIEKPKFNHYAPAFFGLTCQAFLESSMTKLYKLYDNNPNTISIIKYLNIVEQQFKSIFDNSDYSTVIKIVSKHKQDLEGLKDKILKLKKIRDSFLAHNDKTIIRDEENIWKKVQLIIEDIHTLIHWISEVINEYRVINGKPYVFIESTNKFDVDRVITIINDHIQTN